MLLNSATVAKEKSQLIPIPSINVFSPATAGTSFWPKRATKTAIKILACPPPLTPAVLIFYDPPSQKNILTPSKNDDLAHLWLKYN